MAYRRSSQSTDIELARLQDKAESWSDDLDGEHGVIREFRRQTDERNGQAKLLKGALAGLGVITAVQALLAIWQAVHPHG